MARFTNAKLARHTAERLIKDKFITSKSIDTLLYLCANQNAIGDFYGIYYKTTCLKLNISAQTFYNCITQLENLGYIKINWYDRKAWSGTILNNVFLDTQDDKKGYMKTNIDFLYSSKFRNLRANEKKIIFYLLLNYRPDKGLKIYPRNLGSIIGINNLGLIDSYISNIKAFFPCNYAPGKKDVLISFNRFTTFLAPTTENESYLYNRFSGFCYVHNICYTITDIKDLIILCNQYANIGIKQLFKAIEENILSKKVIIPRLINTLLKRQQAVII